MAVLLAVVGYQNLVVYPGMKKAAEHRISFPGGID